MKSPIPAAVALALFGFTAEERVLVVGSLDDALAYAAGAGSEAQEDNRPTVRPEAP